MPITDSYCIFKSHIFMKITRTISSKDNQIIIPYFSENYRSNLIYRKYRKSLVTQRRLATKKKVVNQTKQILNMKKIFYKKDSKFLIKDWTNIHITM